ncbi:tRNA (adenine(58)-N(1))-methyltransferase non-catalytic subunit trm6 [Pestalotiopsis sp. IQ-011]
MSSPSLSPQTSQVKSKPQTHGNEAGSLTPQFHKTPKGDTAAYDPAFVNGLRQDSLSPFSFDGRLTPLSSVRGPSPAPHFRSPPAGQSFKQGVRSSFWSQWHRNGGPMLIVLSQLFGAIMNLSTRVLELEDNLHPMQILCARMTATVSVCFVYMWYRPIPSAPWGPREIRPLLVLRACSGFVGLYGMWCSIVYLPLAEATVISFLAPNCAGYLCRIFLKEPFTRREQLASYIALAGVILITRPISLLSSPPEAPADAASVLSEAAAASNSTAPGAARKGMEYIPTVAERLSGVGAGLLGVVGGALAITSLRSIGPRAHPLISVNYFSLFCTVVSIVTLAAAPALGWGQDDQGQGGLRFALPSGTRQCGLLLVIGLAGFGTQFLLAAGLAREKSNRATAMIYTHVLFAAAFDRYVFGQTMGWVSVAGCGLVVGSALWVALGKGADEPKTEYGRSDLEASRGGAVGTGTLPGGEDIAILAAVDVDASLDTDDIDLGVLPSPRSD